ncbi:MAG TPA: hypothetical protein VGG19_08850 [Tepidisphaeraceae bacterium]
MNLRRAVPADVPRMVELSTMKRLQYAAYSPIFWRPAVGADESQKKFFVPLVDDPSWICLVHEAAGEVNGFVMARIISAPPVYDPGGKVCMIDDFVVAEPSLWESVGMALHMEAEKIAGQSGAVISITVCGEHDAVKRTALRGAGAQIASEWYVHQINKQNG